HFKFRRTVSQRLDKRINSAYLWRHESVQFRDYLESHSNRVPLEGAFVYSREELFRRRLLKELPSSTPGGEKSHAQSSVEKPEETVTAPESQVKGKGESRPQLVQADKKVMFVLPKTTEFGG